DLQHVFGNPPLARRDAVEAAQPEARRDLGLFAVNAEWSVGDSRAHFTSRIECLLVAGLGQHDRKLFAADARHPVDSATQRLLQPGTELCERLVAAGVPECIVDSLE